MIEYDASSSGLVPQEITTVFSGTVIQMRVWPKASGGMNAKREWPYLIYRPTVDCREELPTWRTSPSSTEKERDPIQYLDDGSGLFCPTTGKIYLCGGVGLFDVLLLKAKPDGARVVPQKPEWKITREFLETDGRIVGIPCGFGASFIEVDVWSLIYFRHGDAFTSAGVYVRPEHPALVPPGATAFDIEKLDVGSGQFRVRGYL